MNYSICRSLILPAVFALSVLLLVVLVPAPAAAQSMMPGLLEQAGTAQVQDYGRPGYPRVQIYLWGNANHGVWKVEEGTDLLEYLSLAGQGDFKQGAETRVTNVLRMYRDGQVGAEPVFETQLEDLFARQVESPVLQEGDVLVLESIERRRTFTFRQASQITGTIASIATLVFLLQD
jgi:hypothetical protein